MAGRGSSSDWEYQTVELYENQRWYPSGWSANLMLTDRPTWSNQGGTIALPDVTRYRVPSAEWEWVGDWQLDTDGGRLADSGWAYCFNFNRVGQQRRGRQRMGDFTRWRRHTRLMRREKTSGSDAPAVHIGWRCPLCYAPNDAAALMCIVCDSPAEPPASGFALRGKASPALSSLWQDASASDEPLYLACPITFELFSDPVITPDGHTFERKALLDHIARDGTCPLSRKPLSVASLVTNRALRAAVAAWQDYCVTGIGSEVADAVSAGVPGAGAATASASATATCSLCEHVNPSTAVRCSMCDTPLAGLSSVPAPLQRQLSDKAQALLRVTLSEPVVGGVPRFLCCPLSLRLSKPVCMTDPVVTPEGDTYERELLLQHLATSATDPSTGAPLRASQLIPNRCLKAAADAFLSTVRQRRLAAGGKFAGASAGAGAAASSVPSVPVG